MNLENSDNITIFILQKRGVNVHIQYTYIYIYMITNTFILR